MILKHPSSVCPVPSRRGSALLMAFLVLVVLAAILFQLYITTSTDARVARNDVTLTAMDQAIESALIRVFDELETDAQAAAAGGAAGAPPTSGGGDLGGSGDPAAAGAAGAAGGAPAPSVDSREDSWGRPVRSTINELELRILVQDEDSKLNVLGMLTADESEAEKALERVVRVLDLCREDTSADIDRGDARRLAEAMRDHFRQRGNSRLPKADLLSDTEEERDRGLPLSLRELVVLEPFHEGLFREFRDDRGRIVHSIGSYLTVWTALKTLSEVQPGAAGAGQSGAPSDSQGNPQTPPAENGQPGQGGEPSAEGAAAGAGASDKAGVAVNINTAPAAVLKALMDDRDVAYRLWDEVIEYRNLEEEPPDGEEIEPVYDEFGEPIVPRKVFDSLEKLEEIGGWDHIQAETRAEVERLLTTQSGVFSIFVTARRATGAQDDFGGVRGAPPPGEREDELGNAITRTVRCVIWRYQDGEEWRMLPLVRWEVLDYTPFEVQDYPDPDR